MFDLSWTAIPLVMATAALAGIFQLARDNWRSGGHERTLDDAADTSIAHAIRRAELNSGAPEVIALRLCGT
jgi:hypothetical protein